MIFTLEVLQAKYGDSLLLHYGTKASPKLIIIDGGPGGVFDISLRPRLEQIKNKRSPEESLPVRMVMVSHIDEDHIRGILDLTELLIEQQDQHESLLCDITTLWHNSFDEILGNNETKAIAASLGSVVKLSSTGDIAFPPGLFQRNSAAAIAASVAQGRRLRNNADQLALLENAPFKNLVALSDSPNTALKIDENLDFTVLCPTQRRLEKLQKDWDKKLEVIQKKEAAEARALAAEFIDKSVYNLSSIVVLAESDGKKMLFTGDALAADILESLKTAGLLKDGKTLHIDLLKMQHHGSIKNSTEEFLKSVTADHYVMSANGKHEHPSIKTLEMLSEVRGSDTYTVHLTNPVPHAVTFYDADKNKAGKNYKVNIRDENALSLQIDLDEPFND